MINLNDFTDTYDVCHYSIMLHLVVVIVKSGFVENYALMTAENNTYNL